MSTITVTITPDEEDVGLGFESTHTLHQENIIDAHHMAHFLADVCRAAGFTYVEDVALFSDGDDKWASWDFVGAIPEQIDNYLSGGGVADSWKM